MLNEVTDEFVPIRDLKKVLKYKDNISVRKAFERAEVPLTRITYKQVGSTHSNLQKVLQFYAKQKSA
jgi:hypothetical protein